MFNSNTINLTSSQYTNTNSIHKTPLQSSLLIHEIWQQFTNPMSHSLIQTSGHTNTSFFVQLPRQSRAFHWLIKIERLHRVLQWLELDTNLNSVRTASRNSSRARLSGTDVRGQRLHNLLQDKNRLPMLNWARFDQIEVVVSCNKSWIDSWFN
jgi:hypothetical protein